MSTTKTKKRRPKDASLLPMYNPEIRQEYLDYDYLSKLSEEEYEWLAAFTHEYNCANRNHEYKKIFKRNKEARKEHTDRNNQRNRDMYGKARAKRSLVHIQNDTLEPLENAYLEQRNPEDALIQMIDNKNNEFKMEKMEKEFRRAKQTLTRSKRKSRKRQRRLKRPLK